VSAPPPAKKKAAGLIEKENLIIEVSYKERGI
jgi:hypothetical protein